MSKASDAVMMAEHLFPDSFWAFSKRRVERMEPLWAFQLMAVNSEGLHDQTVDDLIVEDHDPVACVVRMAQKCGAGQPSN